MSRDKIRRQVAWEAARLMYCREVSEYLPAKLKAARRVARGHFKPSDLPSNSEICDQVQIWATLHEGDSLQVFELARRELPYDEEFLAAALLHDVGKAIDRSDHVAADLEALTGHITPRSAWLIEHHMEGQRLLDGTLGVRARRRLESSDDFEELKLLVRCDRDGRRPGGDAPELAEAIEYLRELSRMCGE